MDNCSSTSVLTDDDFTYGGTTYSFASLYLDALVNRLNVITSSSLPAVIRTHGRFTVGSNTLSFSSATFTGVGNTNTHWNSPGFTWTDDQVVQLSLTMTAGLDVTRPTVLATGGFSPDDGATDVAKGANLVISFSEAVQAGTGNIVIKNLDKNAENPADTTDDRTISITDSQVTFGSGSNTHKVTINPTNDLLNGANYAVRIATTAIRDRAPIPNNFRGITDDTTWNFTIIAGPTLDAEDVTGTTATLRIGNHTAKWWYQRTSPTTGTCTEVAAGTATARVSSLTAGTSYTYKAYLDTDSDGDCDAADEIASETFTATPDTTAPTVLATNGFSPAPGATNVAKDNGPGHRLQRGGKGRHGQHRHQEPR